MEQEVAAAVKTQRMCSRFHCDYRGDRYCCADCWSRKYCENPCLNDPSRCGLEDDGKRRIFTAQISKIKP